jgi:hypothetical protein
MHTSCRLFVDALERCPPLEGHLSRIHGFLPPGPTKAQLPPSHRIWDEVAAELPALFVSNATQRILADLPVLSVEPEALDDADLTRASVVISALGHAYWRFGVDRFFPQRITQVPPELPDSILQPWRGLARRLGRHDPEHPFQNFYDLFLSNFRLAPHAPSSAPLVIENLEVLVPSFGNDAERVFYMSFVEMHHHFTPVVGAVCDLDDGVRQGDVGLVIDALGRIRRSFVRATSVWNKISARKGSAVYCDPVLWSKTTAILGVPPEGCTQGATSGACAPVLYLMDALLQRTDYGSRYGQFMAQQARAMVAPTVHELAQRVRGIPLAPFIERHAGTSDGASLRDALDGVIDSYSGQDGWLGRHAAKVFNYLCISTVTGRNASVSGDERYFGRQTWIDASAELHESRHERAASRGGCPMGHGSAPAVGPAPSASGPKCPFAAASRPAATPPQRAPTPPAPPADLPLFSRLDVARHHRDGALWIIIDQCVYDVSHYAARHPGGSALLVVYAGQDVSQVFWGQRVHQAATIPRLLEQHRIGRVPPPPATSGAQRLYDVLYTLIRARQSLSLQYEHPMGSEREHAESVGRGALKLFSDENTHMMLWRENLPAAYELLRPGGWAAVAREPAVQALLDTAQSLSGRFDFREPATPDLSRSMARRSRTIARRDTALVDRLIRLTAASLAAVDADAGQPDAARRAAARVEGDIAAVDAAQPSLSLEAAGQQLATRLRDEISRDAQRRGTARSPAGRTLGDASLGHAGQATIRYRVASPGAATR